MCYLFTDIFSWSLNSHIYLCLTFVGFILLCSLNKQTNTYNRIYCFPLVCDFCHITMKGLAEDAFRGRSHFQIGVQVKGVFYPMLATLGRIPNCPVREGRPLWYCGFSFLLAATAVQQVFPTDHFMPGLPYPQMSRYCGNGKTWEPPSLEKNTHSVVTRAQRLKCPSEKLLSPYWPTEVRSL